MSSGISSTYGSEITPRVIRDRRRKRRRRDRRRRKWRSRRLSSSFVPCCLAPRFPLPLATMKKTFILGQGFSFKVITMFAFNLKRAIATSATGACRVWIILSHKGKTPMAFTWALALLTLIFHDSHWEGKRKDKARELLAEITNAQEIIVRKM